MSGSKKVQKVFDTWAQDYHADGMEKSHWASVEQAFSMIPENNGNYLEIGIGNGYGIHHMATHQFSGGQCYGLDISPLMVDRTRQRLDEFPNVTLQRGDFLHWQSPHDVRFSLIFSMEVFYYFQDIQQGIHRAAELLQPGGTLMVLVNYYMENTNSHSWAEELETPMVLWSKANYVNGFCKAGFQHVEQKLFLQDLTGQLPGTLGTWGIVPE